MDALTATLERSALWTEGDAKAWQNIRGEIMRALSPGSALATAAKAANLMLEQRLVFSRVRVLTDLRPVFDDSGTSVEAVVSVHTLALTCYEEGHRRVIHVAMDTEDIGRLCEQLERARRKEEVLRQRLREADIPTVGIGGEADDE